MNVREEERPVLSGLNSTEFEHVCGEFLETHSQPAYRGRQIREWVFQRKVGAFEEMSDLPKPLREALDSAFLLQSLDLSEQLQSTDGTKKFLWGGAGEGEGVLESICRQSKGRPIFPSDIP